MQGSIRRRFARGAALAAAFATLSCGRETGRVSAEAAASPRGAAETRPLTPEVPFAEGAKGALPKELPADVPSYPGASLVASSSAPEQGVLIAYQSRDAPEKVFEFYRETLPEQGWTVEGEMSSADQRMLIAGKDDRKASVLVSASDGGETEITLTLTHGKG